MPLPKNWYSLAAEFGDLGTAETLTFVTPTAGYVRKVTTVLDAAITGTDETITVSVDGSALSPTITVAVTGSGAGVVDSAEFYAPVKAGARVTVASAGDSTGAAGCAVTVTFSG